MVKSFLGQSNIHVLLDIFIATSHDLGVPLNPVESSLSGRVCMDMPNSMKFRFFEGMWLFVFPFFVFFSAEILSFFRFIFRMTKKSERRENKRKKSQKLFWFESPGQSRHL